MDVLGTPTLQKAQRLELGTSGVCVYIIIEYIYIYSILQRMKVFLVFLYKVCIHIFTGRGITCNAALVPGISQLVPGILGDGIMIFCHTKIQRWVSYLRSTSMRWHGITL